MILWWLKIPRGYLLSRMRNSSVRINDSDIRMRSVRHQNFILIYQNYILIYLTFHCMTHICKPFKQHYTTWHKCNNPLLLNSMVTKLLPHVTHTVIGELIGRILRKDTSNFLDEPSSRLLFPRVRWWLRNVCSRLLSLNPKSSQTGCECEPRGRRLHSALKTKDNSNRNRLANGIWCVEESITCSVILLPFNSCEEPKGFLLHSALHTKRDNKGV